MVIWALPTDLSENKFGKVDVIKTSLFVIEILFFISNTKPQMLCHPRQPAPLD